MRVAIAVTDGYLASGFETLRSEAPHFSLNLALEVKSVMRMLGRLSPGISRIARRRGRRAHGLQSGASDDWLPSMRVRGVQIP